MFPERVQAVLERVDRLRHEVDDAWQIPRAEALLLAQLVRLGRCRSLLEIGTSYGYSTLHLAAAAREHGGRVHTVDINPAKTAAATRHLTEAGLLEHVTLHTGDARLVVAELLPAEPFDFVFIDAAKPQSEAYLDALLPRLAPRATLVTDNTSTHAEQLAGFVRRLRELAGAASCQVDVGNGFELTILTRR